MENTSKILSYLKKKNTTTCNICLDAVVREDLKGQIVSKTEMIVEETLVKMEAHACLLLKLEAMFCTYSIQTYTKHKLFY